MTCIQPESQQHQPSTPAGGAPQKRDLAKPESPVGAKNIHTHPHRRIEKLRLHPTPPHVLDLARTPTSTRSTCTRILPDGFVLVRVRVRDFLTLCNRKKRRSGPSSGGHLLPSLSYYLRGGQGQGGLQRHHKILRWSTFVASRMRLKVRRRRD